jgi:UDP-N-acetylmuramoylalanine--D-glutamate ligase
MSCPGGALQDSDMHDRRAAVVGLAREGEALTRFLVRHGCCVVATDLRSPASFGDRLSLFADSGVQLVLGGHPPSLLDGCEVVFVSPGVPFDSPLLQEARMRGLLLSTESRLFCQLCPAPITAITGSSGKTTTTTLVGEMLKADNRSAWVGGNIGQPLIESLDQIRPADHVVMELSSFQLEYYHPSANAHVESVHPVWTPLLCGWSPPVGAILNITPNHLDRHPSMEAYIHAKRAVIAYRRPWDAAILGLENHATRALGDDLQGDVRWFSRLLPVPLGARLSGTGREATITLCRGGNRGWRPGTASLSLPADVTEEPVCRVGDVQLRGEHNLDNLLAACAIADALGVSVDAMRHVCGTFAGVEHRLEWVRDVGGVHYCNDSIATTPERLVAALRSFDEPVVLLVGGRDKHLPWDQAAQLMLRRTRHVVLFGEAAELIADALADARELATPGQDDNLPTVHRCATLEEALLLAAGIAKPGYTVLLSPGCASFDAFADFAERGARFRQLVNQMQMPGSVSGASTSDMGRCM